MDRTRRILVVTAQDGGGELREWLERAGYQVGAARPGGEAVGMALSEGHGAAVVEAEGGLDASISWVGRIRQGSHTDFYLPILLVAEGSDAGTRAAAIREGADDCISRPVEPAELLARVERLLRIRATHDRLVSEKAELEYLSCTDGLTHLHNRRSLIGRLREEFRRALRHRTDLAVVMLDLDHFKQINDRYGHFVGDEVLREVADVLRTTVRESDTVGRFGGEEFVLVLPLTNTNGAVRVVERIREAMAEKLFGGRRASIPVTASAGIAAWPNPSVDSAEALLEAADEALYGAKRAGRNRLFCLHELEETEEGTG